MSLEMSYTYGQPVQEEIFNGINHQGNTCKNLSYHLTLVRMLVWLWSKRQKISVSKDVDKGEHLYTIGSDINWYSL